MLPSTALDHPQLTQHALLVAWGHFAQSLDVVPQFLTVPIPQKTVHAAPVSKLLTLFLGLLTGCEYLSDLSLGSTPISRDPVVAAAWGLPTLASTSAVSRTLAACTPASFHALQQVVDRLTAPFLQQALTALRAQQAPLQLDVDLTGRPVSSTSQTYPGAAFGYMDGEIRLGYQLAAICLHTPQYGRLWLVGHHHSGDTVSTTCLSALLAAAETRLGCHPRRRTELLQARIATQQIQLAAAAQGATTLATQVRTLHTRREEVHALQQQLRRRITRLTADPISPQQAGPFGALTQAQQQLAAVDQRAARLMQQVAQLLDRQRQVQAQIHQLQTALQSLQARHAELAAANAAQPDAPRCRLRMDAGFCSGETLTRVLELGYEVETKAGARAAAALRARITPDMRWTRVGKNAEMIGWANYQMYNCPYPVLVALERFHTPHGLKYSVLVRNQEAPTTPVPDLREWFASYCARQTIEAGIKQSKTVFKVQRLWSRSAVGMQVQALLTLFAANFVAWGREWLQERVEVETASAARALRRPKQLVRVAANSPATVERANGEVVVRFSSLSGLPGTVIHLVGPPGGERVLNRFISRCCEIGTK
jgi:hypothetical protein